MKIAFWSNSSDACSVSANMAAVSVAAVIRYPFTLIAMENRLSINNLGMAFLGHSHVAGMYEVGTNYYDGSGIEGLLRKIYRGSYHAGMLGSYLKEVISDHLFYIPQSGVIHNDIFEYELNHSIHPLLNMVEGYADICVIDTASHNNLSTKTILEEADLIVVNLCQKQSILEDFFLNYSSLISKAVFIIGNYDIHTKFNVRRIANMYEIPAEDIIPLPYNELYNNAYSRGNVVEFISRNYSCLKDNPNFIFIQSVKKATYIIIKKAVELSKAKGSGMCLR